MNILSSSVRGEVLNSTYPALLVVFFSILEGNTVEATWVAQHSKTLQITEENHRRLEDKIAELGSVRSISLKVGVGHWVKTRAGPFTKIEVSQSWRRPLLGPLPG